MGILDDAIREHLELKRQLGAREAEVKRLEDEAFGPSARPGEPEFGEAAPQGDDAGEPIDKAAADAAATDVQREPIDPAAPGAGATDVQDPDASALESQPALVDEPTVRAEASAPTSDPPAESAPAEQQEAAAADSQPPLPSEPVSPPIDAPSADTTEAPPSDIEIEDFEVGDLNLAIDEDPELAADEDDNGEAGHGAVTAGAEGGAVTPDEPIADTAESPFDFESSEDEAVELEISAPPTETYTGAPDADKAGDEGAAGYEAAPAEGRPVTDDEPPREAQEAPAAQEPDSGWLPEGDDPGVTDADVPPASAPRIADDPQPADPAPAISEGAPEEGRPPDERVERGEDVLEETPEFLRDAPESDRMWFEQGEPQDFDFDDEK